MKKIKLIAAVLLMSVAVTMASSQLINAQYLPTPPPGWQIIKIEDPGPYGQGQLLLIMHIYLQNVSTHQVAVWTVTFSIP